MGSKHPAAIFKLRTGVAEQAGDFIAKRGDNVGIKQGVQPSKKKRADDDGDQNLDSRIHISFSLFAPHGRLDADGSGTNLIFDCVK